MIQVEERVAVRRSADEAFAYLSDFQNLPDWDPGIARSRRLSSGPLAVGARFDVVARFMGREVPMAYELVRYDAAARTAELRGTAAGIRATDRISVAPSGDGRAEVRWQADFELTGLNRFLSPLMRPLFGRLATKAMKGLVARLG